MKEDLKTRPDNLDSLSAAKYLGISEQRLWRHVRKGRLTPCGVTPNCWLFSRKELDDVLKPYYKKSSKYRCIAGFIYVAIAAVGLALSIYLSLNCRSESVMNRLFFCFCGSLLGVGFRALWLTQFPLPLPRFEYTFFYLAFSVVLCIAAYVAAELIAKPNDAVHFFATALVIAFMFGFLIHPEFWPLPSWIRTRS
jgi:hypothetical protein